MRIELDCAETNESDEEIAQNVRSRQRVYVRVILFRSATRKREQLYNTTIDMAERR